MRRTALSGHLLDEPRVGAGTTRSVPPAKLSDLSPARQALVRLFQSVNHGQVRNLSLQGGDPIYHPEPIIIVDIRLDSEDGERTEADLADFVLRQEILRLLAYFDVVGDGVIEKIEIYSGIPRRAAFERRITESRP